MSTSGGPAGGSGSGTVTSVAATDSTITISGTPTVTPTVGVNAIPESKVTNLTTDLAAKAPLASPTFTGVPAAPTAAAGDNTTQLATDAFVTTAIANAIAAVNPAVAVQAATAAILPNSPTYNNGAAGIGATLTTATLNTALVVDGYTPVLNDRILVKNQAAALQNGVYTVTQVAAVGLAWILTRALDYDQPSDINNTGAIPVVNGTANTQTQWVLTSTVNTVGTDALTFTQFSLNPSTILTNTLTSAHLLVGNASNVATDRAITGDVTIGNTGVTALKNTGPGATGPLGSASRTPVVTIDAQGRITALTDIADSYLAAPAVFTSTGTWTPSTTGQAIFVALVVGGGGGGANGSTTGLMGGGGGGEVLEGWYLGNVVGNQTVTIGAGGGAAANGSDTSIGALVTAKGGKAGATSAGGNSGDGTLGATTSSSNPNPSGVGGIGGGNSISARGGAGTNRFGAGGGGTASGLNTAGGAGGSSAGGSGGTAATNSNGGGGGGGGGNGSNGSGTTGANGGTAPANSGGGGGAGGNGSVAGGAGGSGGSGYVVIFQVA